MLDETPVHMEMWAGVECTLNRVGDCYRDQLELAGHYSRPNDIDSLIGLGVRSIRYPVLWERHANNDAAWVHTDHALERLRRAGIDPIVGLVHHGSGPAHCTLLDAAFPAALAEFARVVALRYPWITRYTPVNEPMTTARFAALYGHWYPHHRSDRSFVRALLHQVRGIQQAMRAIRDLVPNAELVATEDLGHTFASADLRNQARFENDRRWLTWDLLDGRVDPAHALWKYLTSNGAEPGELREIQTMAAVESKESFLIGVNHYLTSERYLDSNTANYPIRTHGGNGRQQYADVEAVRALPEGPLGVGALLMQTWERYNRPIAITEAHLGCTREQQLLWLQEIWCAAGTARSDGADVRAVTAWAAFGSFDWNSLLTRDDGSYESGLFAIESGELRPTALATMVSSLAASGSFSHPGLHAKPWWRSARRLHFDGKPSDTREHVAPAVESPTRSTESPFGCRLLLLVEHDAGAGDSLATLIRHRGLACEAISAAEFEGMSCDESMCAPLGIDVWAAIHISHEINHRYCGLLTSDAPETMHVFVDRLLDREPGITMTLAAAAP